MANDFHLFEPDENRVHEFDSLMRLRLTETLRHIHETADGCLNISDSLLNSGINRILEKPILADTFAAYYELVHAIYDDNLDLATQLFEEVLTAPACGQLELIPYLGKEDARSNRYINTIDTDPDLPFAITPVSKTDFDQASKLIHQSYTFLKECDPALHAELSALLRSIVIGSGSTAKKARTFDGASAFEIWGAIVLNAIEAKDIVDMVQTLTHESSHVMLFGYCIDGQLILNPDSERYASPLRQDPRPIDGIYHAVFILARMFYASTVLCESDQLDTALKEKADNTRRQFAKRFYDGLGTLNEHARYTEIGKNLMDAAESYMDQKASHLILT